MLMIPVMIAKSAYSSIESIHDNHPHLTKQDSGCKIRMDQPVRLQRNRNSLFYNSMIH